MSTKASIHETIVRLIQKVKQKSEDPELDPRLNYYTAAYRWSADCYSEPLYHRPGKHVQRQVVGAAGLRVGAGEAEAAERLHTDERAGDGAVEVEVAGLELGAGLLQVIAVFGVDAAGETVGGVVGYTQGLVEVAGLVYGEDGTKDLLLRYPRLRINLAEDGGFDEVAALLVARLFTR